MTDATDFAKLAADKHRDLTIGDAEWLHRMAKDGDLVHIDGAFVQALGDLADKKSTTYAGCHVSRDYWTSGGYYISKLGRYTEADNAIQALIAASDSLDQIRFDHWDMEPDEPEPLDAETVAARQHAHGAALRDAGRGHMVKP